jgi:hypothetical protein
MLEDINEKLKDKMSLLRKRLREPDMKEVFESRFKSIIDINKATTSDKKHNDKM